MVFSREAASKLEIAMVLRNTSAITSRSFALGIAISEINDQ